MKYFLIFCFLITPMVQVFALEKDFTEEKLVGMFKKFIACMQHCQDEKDRITPGYYEYMKKKCHEPFVQLLHDLEKAEQNK